MLDFDEKLFLGEQKISLFLASDQTANQSVFLRGPRTHVWDLNTCALRLEKPILREKNDCFAV